MTDHPARRHDPLYSRLYQITLDAIDSDTLGSARDRHRAMMAARTLAELTSPTLYDVTEQHMEASR